MNIHIPHWIVLTCQIIGIMMLGSLCFFGFCLWCLFHPKNGEGL